MKTTVIYHIETGLVLSEGAIISNGIFASTEIDSTFLPITYDTFLIIDHNTKTLIDITNKEKDLLDSLHNQIIELKEMLAQSDMELVYNIDNEEFKNRRNNIRLEINRLESLRESAVLKFNISGSKYKLIKYIEGVCEKKEVAIIINAIKKLIEIHTK